jgi:hypothetical protein
MRTNVALSKYVSNSHYRFLPELSERSEGSAVAFAVAFRKVPHEDGTPVASTSVNGAGVMGTSVKSASVMGMGVKGMKMKGAGFSPYIPPLIRIGALAPEGRRGRRAETHLEVR